MVKTILIILGAQTGECGKREFNRCLFETAQEHLSEKFNITTTVIKNGYTIDDGIVKWKKADHSMSIDTKLDTHPQTAVVMFDGETLKAETSALNGKEFGNCFHVYNSKLINKITGETEVNRDNLSRICHGEDGHELIPDLCPDKTSSSIPTNQEHGGGGFVDPECHEGHIQINGICKFELSEPLVPPHIPEELDERCKNDQALCERIIIHGPNVLTPKNNSEDVLLTFLTIVVSVAFILGIIYWWKKK